MVEIDRRKFLTYCLLASQAPLLTGCPIFLLRLFLGRGLVRGLRFGLARGGIGSLVTLGRGMSVAARVHRISNFTAKPNTRILTSTGRLLSKVEEDKNSSKRIIVCRSPKGVDYMATEIKDDTYEHFDYQGNYLGRGFQKHTERTEMFDYNNNFQGYDIMHDKDGFIEHFDRRKKYLGKSDIKSDSEGKIVEADEKLEKAIKSFEDLPIAKCPEVQEAYNRLREVQSACDQGDRQACRRVSRYNSALSSLEAECR